MNKFKFIAEEEMLRRNSTPYPQSEIGKRFTIQAGQWKGNNAIVKKVLQTNKTIKFELYLLFSEMVPEAADMITYMSEAEYQTKTKDYGYEA